MSFFTGTGACLQGWREVSSTFIWRAWLVAAAITFAAYLPTLTLTKHIWQDEVQILELGRIVLPGADLSSSMAWHVAESRPAFTPSYLGPALQEVCHRIFAPGPAGARVSAILGGVLASAAMLAWLLALGIARPVALACSLLLLWDPLFVESYRGARVDSWCMAFMLIGLWIIAVGRRNRRPGYLPSCWEVLAGLAIAISGLMWLSAVLVLPLVALQWLQKSPEKDVGKLGARCSSLIWTGLFAAAFCILLLLPMFSSNHALLADNGAHVEQRVTAAINWRGILDPFLSRSPLLFICGFAGIVYIRAWALGLALLSALVAVLLTGAYSHRSVYLVPYLLLAVATCVSNLLSYTVDRSRVKQAIAAALLALMLLWSAGLSLGARTYVAWKEREYRDPAILTAMLRANVGDGFRKAYLVPYELYYAARELGWAPFKPYFGTNWEDSGHRALVSSMDVVVQRADGASQKLEDLMLEQGFTRRKIAAGPGPAPRQENYGEYIVYVREAGTD